MKISKRLEVVSTYVNDLSLIDVGCDHAYLPIYLMEKKRIHKAIATDIADGSVEKARYNIKKSGYENNIVAIKSDGIKDICIDNYKILSICGMGGITISKILMESKDKLEKFSRIIVQPQSEVDKLIETIKNLKFSILDEDFVYEDGQNYPILILEKGEMNEYYFGKYLADNNDYIKFCQNEHSKYKNIYDNIDDDNIKAKKELAIKIEKWGKILERINNDNKKNY